MNKVDVVTALVIVESPAKAKTIEKYLGDGYVVDSSVGHIRDLVSPKDVPDDKKECFGKLGIDVCHDFEPLYAVSSNSKKQVAQLKKALKKVDELYLATDEDREGEAIAWHLLEVLNPSVPVKRMVFNEITKEAITEALENTRDLSDDLVEAQETRRILDRIYGFELSNVTRKKVGGGASAGRVQSPATRLVIERERERMRYVTAGYWGLKTEAVTDSGESFSARLLEIDGLRIATGKDFNEKGNWDSDLVSVLDENAANDLSSSLEQKTLEVDNNKRLVHLVLIKFKEQISSQQFQKLTDGAYDLQAIPVVEQLNFAANVSPEGLGKGYTHSLTMKFKTANDRDSVYLPHPIHKKLFFL